MLQYTNNWNSTETGMNLKEKKCFFPNSHGQNIEDRFASSSNIGISLTSFLTEQIFAEYI